MTRPAHSHTHSLTQSLTHLVSQSHTHTHALTHLRVKFKSIINKLTMPLMIPWGIIKEGIVKDVIKVKI